MIWQPKKGQFVGINYKDKSMPFQGYVGVICAVGSGKGPKNVLVFLTLQVFIIVPRGNLNDLDNL